jgi:ribonuclease HI
MTETRKPPPDRFVVQAEDISIVAVGDGSFLVKTDAGKIVEPGKASGEGSIGVILRDPDGKVIEEVSERIGWVQDHHVGEYRAFITGMVLARKHGATTLTAFLDSRLVEKQAKGEWRVRKAHLVQLHEEAVRVMQEFDVVPTIRWVPRAQNWEAHRLASKALKADPDA